MQTQAFLPLVTYPDANSDATAANAVAMAAALNASLHALAVNTDIPNISNRLSKLMLDLPEMIRQTERMSRERGTHLLAEVERHAGRAGVEATIGAIAPKAGFLAEAAAEQARYFDYVLCGWESGNPTCSTNAETIVFGSGRPTIMLPELAPVGDIDDVAVAWDGSRVAARAVADAMPLLRKAGKISVLTVIGEKPLHHADPAERLASGLNARGLNATPVVIRYQDGSLAATLQDRAIDAGARLLVMGAYGHSRMREFVLGGATAGVLADLRMPVLLSH